MDTRDSGVLPRANELRANELRANELSANELSASELSASELSASKPSTLERSAGDVDGAGSVARGAASDTGAGNAAAVDEHEVELADLSSGSANGVVSTIGAGASSTERGEEETFEIADDELQAAEDSDRISLIPPGGLVARHRPPPPPSMRPRPAGASPSGVFSSSAFPSSAYPSAQRPSEGPAWSVKGRSIPPKGQSASQPPSDDARWALANRTLELTRAKARCSELETLLAKREARIVALERELAQALGQSGEPAPATAPSATMASATMASATMASATAAGTARAAASTASAAAASRVPFSGTPVAATPASATPASGTFASAVVGSSSVSSSGAAEEAAPLSVDARWSEPDDESAELARQPSGVDEVAAGDAQSDAGTEELGKIAGIGPVIAKTLRAQGVTRLSQIAAWSDEDIRRIAKAIKVPKSRISRGRWVQKAREALGGELPVPPSRQGKAPSSSGSRA